MKPGTLWPWMIGGALLLHVVVFLGVVFFLTSDASYAVEEDYYQKAINWDQKRAQDRVNTELGWLLTFEASPPSAPGENPSLNVQLRDGAAQPMNDAVIQMEAFHKAKSDQVIRMPIEPTNEPGLFQAEPAMRDNGLWELRFTVTRGDQTFTHTETKHLFVEGSW